MTARARRAASEPAFSLPELIAFNGGSRRATTSPAESWDRCRRGTHYS